jgi:hypothetical protein
VAISSYWLNLSLGSASRSSCHIDRVARLSSSEHETTRNLCAAHLFCIKRRNRECGATIWMGRQSFTKAARSHARAAFLWKSARVLI